MVVASEWRVRCTKLGGSVLGVGGSQAGLGVSGAELLALATVPPLGCMTAMLAFDLGERVEDPIETWTEERPEC